MPADPAALRGTPTAELIAEARAVLPPDLFAILDGGVHEGLQERMAALKLYARPLFLEAGDADAIASGPFLVPLDTPEQVAAVVAISGAGRTPAIWSWSRGEQELYRHLRLNNLVEIPADRDEVEDEDGEPEAAPFNTVIFRHWDPNVLAVTLPVLRQDQATRLMGPATGLAYAPDHAAPVMLPGMPASPWESPPRLRLSPEQMAGMEKGREHAIHVNIARYLRDAEPEAVAAMDHARLLHFVRETSTRGAELGMSSERALGLWSWLVLCTGGAAARSPEIVHAFRHSGLAPNETMIALIDQMADHETGTGRPT